MQWVAAAAFLDAAVGHSSFGFINLITARDATTHGQTFVASTLHCTASVDVVLVHISIPKRRWGMG